MGLESVERGQPLDHRRVGLGRNRRSRPNGQRRSAAGLDGRAGGDGARSDRRAALGGDSGRHYLRAQAPRRLSRNRSRSSRLNRNPPRSPAGPQACCPPALGGASGVVRLRERGCRRSRARRAARSRVRSSGSAAAGDGWSGQSAATCIADCSGAQRIGRRSAPDPASTFRLTGSREQARWRRVDRRL
jgi:hypothetical protein